VELAGLRGRPGRGLVQEAFSLARGFARCTNIDAYVGRFQPNERAGSCQHIRCETALVKRSAELEEERPKSSPPRVRGGLGPDCLWALLGAGPRLSDTEGVQEACPLCLEHEGRPWTVDRRQAHGRDQG